MPSPARWNLLDLAIVAIVTSVAAAGIAGYRRFQLPLPQISAVTPERMMAGTGRRLSVRGRYLHPALSTYVIAAGREARLDPNAATTQEAQTVTTTASELVVTLPPVSPGPFDLYLYDEFRQVAFVSKAFTVDVPTGTRAELTAIVRFFVAPGFTTLLTNGDRDQSRWKDKDLPATDRAVVTAVRVDPVAHPQLEMRIAYSAGDDAVWIGSRGVLQQVDVDLRVPLAKDAAGEWRYNSAPVRAGQLLDFETSRFKSRGMLIAIGEPHVLDPEVARP
jgi:hypothetical protein